MIQRPTMKSWKATPTAERQRGIRRILMAKDQQEDTIAALLDQFGAEVVSATAEMAENAAQHPGPFGVELAQEDRRDLMGWAAQLEAAAAQARAGGRDE